jgi:hypothetical protein
MHESTKDHIGRFVIKTSIAALIALIVKHENYLFSFSFWVFAYAIFAVVYAVLRRERFLRDHFSYWDEAMWLGATAAVLQVVSRLV